MIPTELESLMVRLGLQQIIRRNENFMACCPNHRERHPSWGVSIHPPHFHGCFACGYRGSLAGLLLTKYGWRIEDVSAMLYLPSKKLADYKLFGLATALPEIDPLVLAAYPMQKPGRDYLAGRGISERTSIQAALGYDRRARRIVFPYFWQGSLYGMTGRTIRSEAENKIEAYEGLPKGSLFYCPFDVLPQSSVIIVEGEIDALSLVQDGYESVLALGFGTFTDEQFLKLCSVLPKKVTLFLDNDKTGKRLTGQIIAKLSGVGFALHSVVYPDSLGFDQKDPASLDRDTRIQMLVTAPLAKRWSLNFSQ